MRIYIDYENVKNSGFSGAELLNENDSVCVFYSDAAFKIQRLYVNVMQKNNVPVEIRKLSQVGKNGLDFYIGSQIGYDIAATEESDFSIISRDAGFHAIQDYWQKVSPVKRNIYLGPNIFDVLERMDDCRGKEIRNNNVYVAIEEFLKNDVKTSRKINVAEKKTEKETAGSDDVFSRYEITESELDHLLALLAESPKNCWNYCLKTYKAAGSKEVYWAVKELAAKQEISPETAETPEEKNDSMQEDQSPEVIMMHDDAPPEKESEKDIAAEEIDPVLMIPEETTEKELSQYECYGSFLASAIAQTIVELHEKKPEHISQNDVVDVLKGKAPDKTKYFFYGKFNFVKDLDIHAMFRQIEETGCILSQPNSIQILDMSLLERLANPKPMHFENDSLYHLYTDADWIHQFEKVLDPNSEDWDGQETVIEHINILYVFRKEAVDYLGNAPKKLLKKMKALAKNNGAGTLKNMQVQVIKQVENL